MDIILVLIVSAIVLYYLFGNPIERKFKLGLVALNENELDKAEELFNSIISKHTLAKTKLNEIAFKRGEQFLISGNLEKAYAYYSLIGSEDSLSAKADSRLIEIDYKRGQDAKTKNNTDLAYQYFSKIAHKDKNAFFEASKIDFNKGVSKEKAGDYLSAIESYKKASLFKDNPKFYLTSSGRNLICQLKSNVNPSTEEIELISNNNAIQSIRDDFYYRYTVKLINGKQYSKAIDTIESKLSHNQEITTELVSFIENSKISKLKEIINETNFLQSNKQSGTQAIEAIYRDIIQNQDLIGEFPDYSERILEVKNNLFNKLVHQYLEEEDFEQCLNLIMESQNFYEKIDLLKNAGICCIRLALSGKLNASNYSKIISVWLTAIYNDDIFLNSLETTSWDDEYTFSVKNTIGRYAKYLFEIKVENINRNDPSDSNVSIGQAQRELLTVFENSLHSIKPEQLNNTIQSFYNKEKDAIDSLVKHLGFDIIHCTPEFAKVFKLESTILKYLNRSYEKHRDEIILELGALYINLVFNDKGGVMLQVGSTFEKYASSKFYSTTTLEHIKNKNTININESFTEVINRFESIKLDFEEQAYALLSHHLRDGSESMPIIQLIEKVHKILPSSERVSYLLAETITSYCIEKINSKSITASNGLELLVKAIVASPENHRTAKNLAILISVNLMEEVFRDKINKLIPALNKIESESLYDSFVSEIDPIKDELKKVLNRPNIDYTKVRGLIQTIDALFAAVKPEIDDEYEF